MHAADRHVLDLVPVPLQVWDGAGDALTLRYANDAAGRAELPREALLEACREQRPGTLELAGAQGACWQGQITPPGGTAVLAAFSHISAPQRPQASPRGPQRPHRRDPPGPPGGAG